jgi:hypothetical protein
MTAPKAQELDDREAAIRQLLVADPSHTVGSLARAFGLSDPGMKAFLLTRGIRTQNMKQRNTRKDS